MQSRFLKKESLNLAPEEMIPYKSLGE